MEGDVSREQQIMDAMPVEAFDRLTRNDKDRAALLEVATAMWGVGYAEGLRRGGQLVAASIAERLTSPSPDSVPEREV